MMRRLHVNSTSLLWCVLIALIPLFSIYGRLLQSWSSQHFTRQQLGLLFAVVLVAMSLAAAVTLVRYRGWHYLWHMLWFAALFVVLPFYVSLAEERIHFILFGLFGFVSLLIYPGLTGFMLCMAVSGLDEGLQYALPDRVGDWRDVMFNLLASTGGGLFALILERD